MLLTDSVPEYFDFGQTLGRVGRCSPLQKLECFVDFTKSSTFPECRRFSSVNADGSPLACLAGPNQTRASTVALGRIILTR